MADASSITIECSVCGAKSDVQPQITSVKTSLQPRLPVDWRRSPSGKPVCPKHPEVT